MYLRLIAFVMTSVFTICAAAESGPTALIQAKGTAWTKALAAHDIDTLAGMYEDQAWLVVPGAPPFQGRAAIHGALVALDKSTSSMQLNASSVVMLGRDYLLENGMAETRPAGAATNVAMHANYQVLWHRNPQGDWKIVRDIVSPR